MASEENNSKPVSGQNLNIKSNVFNKGMMMDFDDIIVPEGVWIRARNAVNNSQNGNVGVIGNEPSNIECTRTINDVMGLIYISDGVWCVFSTDDTVSEIGIYREEDCSYSILYLEKLTNVSRPCLNFKRSNLITGISREKFDCTRQVYFADGLNPDRTFAIKQDYSGIVDDYFVETITDFQTGEDPDEKCEITTYDLEKLDCDKIRLNPLMNPPCVKLRRANYSGNLLNGTYQAYVAYTLDGQRVTDYIGISNPQSLYKHENVNSSLEVVIESIDQRFDEFELVILSYYNGQTQAKKMGVYSTQTGTIFIDIISNELSSIPTSVLPIISTVYEKSEAIYRNGQYAIRIAPTSKFDFNYQPLANLIEAEWFAAAYPEDYYYKGGNKTTYLRDEVYSFFIRWVYNDGQKSPSFHIPGRPKNDYDKQELSALALNLVTDNPEEIDNQRWRYVNTATRTAPALPNPIDYSLGLPGISNTDDGGIIVAKGKMGYWESTEEYPNFKPEIWNSSEHDWTGVSGTSPAYDLCGQRIRHHKFPDMDVIPHFTAEYDTSGDLIDAYTPIQIPLFGSNTITFNPNTYINSSCEEDSVPNSYKISTGKNYKVVLLGVNFNNIKPPVDNNGNLIPGIIGYEILRGNRMGNRTILAKGIFNTVREYDLPEYQTNALEKYQRTGLFYNYPFNDQRDDTLLSTIKVDGGCRTACDFDKYPALSRISTNFLGFDSPETEFFNSFLDVDEFKVNCTYVGSAEGRFTYVKDHPEHALPNDLALIIAGFFGVITAANNTILSGFFSGTPDFATQIGSNVTTTSKQPPIDDLPQFIDGAVSIFMKPIAFVYYTIQITQGYLDAILALLGTRQYALQHKAYCFYSSIADTYGATGKLFKVNTSRYVGPTRLEINEKYILNNVYRTNFTLIQTKGGIPNVKPILKDTTRYTIHKVLNVPITNSNFFSSDGVDYNDPINKTINTRSSTLYGSLKYKIRNIYGQLDQIRQLPISVCMHPNSGNINSTNYTLFG